MEKRAGHGGRHEAGGPWLIQAACGLTTVLQRRGSGFAQSLQKDELAGPASVVLGAGPRAQGGANETGWCGCRHGRGARHRAQGADRQTDTRKHSSPERQPFLTSAADHSPVASHLYTAQASLAPFRPHRSILAHSPFGSHLITHFMLCLTHTLSDHLACPGPPRGSKLAPVCPAAHTDEAWPRSPLSSVHAQPHHSICSIPTQTGPSHTVSSISHADPAGPSTLRRPTRTFTGHSVRSDPHAVGPVPSTLRCPKWAWSARTGTTGMYARDSDSGA